LKGVLQQENVLLSPVLRFGYPCESSFKVLMFSITTIDNFSEKNLLVGILKPIADMKKGPAGP
ncbi:hypothetical protein, partial [Aeromonas veronii]|uniref:hypothetical protein n=1 Tax=Aeromonas veronii TaxID=654 RepID=UPI003D7E108A